jgi:uncharacterized membrane-anchored protein YjiN (DUF445 family)
MKLPTHRGDSDMANFKGQMEEYLDLDSQIKALEKRKAELREALLTEAKSRGGVLDVKTHLAQVVTSVQERVVSKESMVQKLGLEKMRTDGLLQEVTSTSLKVISKLPKV